VAQRAKGTKGAAGRRGAAAAAAERRRVGHRRLALIVLAVFLVGSLVIVGVALGFGDPSVDEGEVAVVEDAPDGTITQEEFDLALEQTAARQGVREVPPPDNPEYEVLKDAAVSDMILGRWVRGEAEDRGIEITDEEVDRRLDSVINQQFGSEEEFNRFLEQSSFTPEQARERIELQLTSERIQESVLPEEPAITQDEIESYYDENLAQFQQPETRDVRLITTKSEAEANEVLAELERDDSPQAFKEVARRFSIDEATKNTGGLREGVVEGQSEPAIDEQIFSAPLDELVGPFETQRGFMVIKVENVTEASTTPIEDATEQIRQTLVAFRQQEMADAFQQDFDEKWRARTFCAEEYLVESCSNAAPPPDPCTEEIAETQGCGAPVPSTRPIHPGTASLFGSSGAVTLPQGPITPQPEAAPGTTVPPGGLPPGAPVPPGGSVPPG
jgi:parvulin-like peptidyl-prolyl isomerase